MPSHKMMVFPKTDCRILCSLVSLAFQTIILSMLIAVFVCFACIRLVYFFRVQVYNCDSLCDSFAHQKNNIGYTNFGDYQDYHSLPLKSLN